MFLKISRVPKEEEEIVVRPAAERPARSVTTVRRDIYQSLLKPRDDNEYTARIQPPRVELYQMKSSSKSLRRFDWEGRESVGAWRFPSGIDQRGERAIFRERVDRLSDRERVVPFPRSAEREPFVTREPFMRRESLLVERRRAEIERERSPSVDREPFVGRRYLEPGAMELERQNYMDGERPFFRRERLAERERVEIERERQPYLEIERRERAVWEQEEEKEEGSLGRRERSRSGREGRRLRGLETRQTEEGRMEEKLKRIKSQATDDEVPSTQRSGHVVRFESAAESDHIRKGGLLMLTGEIKDEPDITPSSIQPRERNDDPGSMARHFPEGEGDGTVLRGKEDIAAKVVTPEQPTSVEEEAPQVDIPANGQDVINNLQEKPTCMLNLVCYRSGMKGCSLHQLYFTHRNRYSLNTEFSRTLLDNPDIITNDRDFFRALRKVYLREMCGPWRRMFFLKNLRGIRLLSFTPTTRPVIVPLDEFVLQEILFAYGNPKKIETENDWIDWVFRLRQADRRHALEFVEGWNGTRIAIAGLMPLLISCVLGIVWSWKTGDVQTAFTVAGFVLTAGTLLLALLAIISGIEASGRAST